MVTLATNIAVETVDPWAWGQEHAELIKQVIARTWQKWPARRYDFEDFAQDAMIAIVERFNYDPDRGCAQSWVWRRVYSTLKNVHRREACEDRARLSSQEEPGPICEESALVDRIDIDRVMRMATEKQREALCCVAAGVIWGEARDRYGVSPQAMQGRIRGIHRSMPHLALGRGL